MLGSELLLPLLPNPWVMATPLCMMVPPPLPWTVRPPWLANGR